MAYQRLGDLLTDIGVLTQQQLQQALALQKGTKKRLGTVLVESAIISETQLIEALQLQMGLEFADLSRMTIPPEMAQQVPKNIAKKHSVVPVKLIGDELYLAMADPLNFVALEEVKAASRKRVVPMISSQAATDRAIMALYGNEGAAHAIEEMRASGAAQDNAPLTQAATQLEDGGQSAPTIRLVNSILERAITEQASDVHLEPRENELMVRMRIDGYLRNILTVPRELQSSVISRIKIMGGMDVAERRVPQDGRAGVRVKQSDVDLRISTLPTIFGEKTVIRLLEKSSHLLTSRGIGLTGADLDKFNQLIANNNGVILLAGPTGSGKSSSMYTIIIQLNSEQVNLVTLEDPVEYNIDGVNQVQINEKTGLTFAHGLRSILRQDPDIIAVGEIRDQETAEIAMRSAITGHLVLSTVHTNDSLSTIDRLLDIGVEPYLVSNALKGVISQRLVRRICPHCRQAYSPSAEELSKLRMQVTPGADPVFYRGAGCPECFHTGYRGRTAVFEIMILNNELKNLVHDRASRGEMQDALTRSGFISLLDNCRRLVLEGVTTVDEAYRTINSTDI